MKTVWCWLILHADLPPGERWVCFRTRDEQRDRLPNAKTPAERDAEILNNEHQIRRWVEGLA